MRRVATFLGLLLLAAAFAVAGPGAGGESDAGNEYFVELDNAFGLIEGGDMKVAGVRAGKITRLKLDRKTKRALVGFQVTKDGFGSLRTDATCATRPQSLIGEYFVDCQPGSAAEKLPDNGRIPVERTTSTIGPDLVNTVLRRPYRERLSLIVNELGAAVAGNEENLNAAIRRASPALRETDKVLKILADQRRTLADLTTNANEVITDLAGNRKDVGRWVLEARDTAAISVTRKAEIAAGFRKLPAFLQELEPTMKALGDTTDAQTPALEDLRASAGQLRTFLDRLGPFADASRPAVDALGEASKTGRQAVRSARPVIGQLRETTRDLPELGKNLAIVLEHLDNPANFVEPDERAAKATGRAMPTGYTGLEGLLTYVYDQALSTNIYDQNNHILKIGVIAGGNCAQYADEASARKFGKECAAGLGPNQPGVNFTDTTRPADAAAVRRARALEDAERSPGAPVGPSGPAGATTAPSAPGASATPPAAGGGSAPAQVGPIEIPPLLPGGLDGALGGKDSAGPLAGLGTRRTTSGPARDQLLDYLLSR